MMVSKWRLREVIGLAQAARVSVFHDRRELASERPHGGQRNSVLPVALLSGSPGDHAHAPSPPLPGST